MNEPRSFVNKARRPKFTIIMWTLKKNYFSKYSFSAFFILSLVVLSFNKGTAQKKVSEFTLVYDYSANAPGSGQASGAESATHTVYVKGNKSRTEINNSLFSSAVIYDANTGNAVILKEVSGQKLLIRLAPENWQERNKMYEGVVYKNTNETKEIAGYKCIKAVGQTRTGASITVYYTRDIVPENKEYDPPFRSLDGLPLEYELTSGGVTIRYKISRLNFNPVPASKFDLPKGGYREMNYEESKKSNF